MNIEVTTPATSADTPVARITLDLSQREIDALWSLLTTVMLGEDTRPGPASFIIDLRGAIETLPSGALPECLRRRYIVNDADLIEFRSDWPAEGGK